MQNQKISFDNDAGHSLSGLMALPQTEPRAYALFAHCFTCSKNLKTATNIAKALTDSGIAVLRFDFTGLGQSEGDFADRNFSANVSDLLAACTSMTLKMYASRKKVDLASATVRVRHGEIHRKDCEDCETKDRRFDQFERELVLEATLTDA